MFSQVHLSHTYGFNKNMGLKPMPMANYETLYEDLGELIQDESLLEKVANAVSNHLIDAYARGRDYGHHLALNEREKIWEIGCQREVPLEKLPRETKLDIQEYIKENNPKRPPRSPRECLRVILEWNGAVLPCDDIVRTIIGIERSVLRDLAPHEFTKAHLQSTRKKAA